MENLLWKRLWICRKTYCGMDYPLDRRHLHPGTKWCIGRSNKTSSVTLGHVIGVEEQ